MVIEREVNTLFDAVAKDDHKAALPAAKALVARLLIDVNRIANALETLAAPPANKG